MKPRNKFQQKAVEASKKLPPLTPAQERWAYTKVIESVGQRTRKGVVTCLDCGKVIEFSDEVIEQRQRDIAKHHNIRLTNHSLYLYGHCVNGDCKHDE